MKVDTFSTKIECYSTSDFNIYIHKDITLYLQSLIKTMSQKKPITKISYILIRLIWLHTTLLSKVVIQ